MSQLDFIAIQHLSNLVADAIIAKTAPAQDIISTRTAERDFGRGWLRLKRDSGQVHPIRMGATRNCMVGYSRHELNCLWHADHGMEVQIIERLHPEHNAKR